MTKELKNILNTLTQGSLIEVGWWDASSSEGWKSADLVEDFLDENMPGVPCATAGYYFGHNFKRLVICGSMGAGEGAEWGDVFVVPLVNIAKLELLKKKVQD